MVRSRLDSLVAIQSKAKMIMTAAANKPSGIKERLRDAMTETAKHLPRRCHHESA
jgi:hypothetical protein